MIHIETCESWKWEKLNMQALAAMRNAYSWVSGMLHPFPDHEASLFWGLL